MNLSILDLRIQKKIVTIVIPQCQVYNQLVYGKILRSIETAIYTCENTYTHMMQLRKYSGKNFMFVQVARKFMCNIFPNGMYIFPPQCKSCYMNMRYTLQSRNFISTLECIKLAPPLEPRRYSDNSCSCARIFNHVKMQVDIKSHVYSI